MAEARRKELEAEGEGEARARTLKAEALRAELEAEGEGQKAVLLGEAEGKQQLAEALNAYNHAALQLSVYPELIQKLPEIAAAIASPMAQVDRIVLIDGGSGNGAGPMGKYSSQVPLMLAQAIETLRAVGLDIPGLFVDESGRVSRQPADGGTTDLDRLAAEIDGSVIADAPDSPAADGGNAAPGT